MSDDYIVVDTAAPYSDLTQRIANGFPDWHAARLQKESLAHQLINATIGVPASEVDQEIQNYRTQTRLLLADTNRNYKAYETDIALTKIKPKKYNLLKNSNFSEWMNPVKLPDHWAVSATENVEMLKSIYGSNTFNYLGGYSLVISSKQDPFVAFGQVRVYQEYTQPSGSDIRTWKCFMHYRRFGVDAVSNSKLGIFMRFSYDDGTTSEVITPVVDVTSWTKLAAKATITKRVKTIAVGVLVNDVLSTDDLFSVIVNNFMLQSTHEELPWCRHITDTVGDLPPSSSDYCVITTARSSNIQKRNVLTELTTEFSPSVLPSSISLDNFKEPESEVTTQIVPSPLSIGPAYLQDGSRWEQSLIVCNERVRAKYGWPVWTLGRIIKFNPNSPQELYATYKPAFIDVDDNSKSYLVKSIFVSCMAENNGKIWLVGRLLYGHSLYFVSKFTTILMVVDKILPKQPTDFDEQGVDLENDISYIPVRRSYMIDSSGGQGFGLVPHAQEGYGGDPSPDSVDAIELTFTDVDKALLKLELGFEATLDLVYDYFTVDSENKKLYTYRNYTLDNPDYKLVIC